MFWGPAAAGGQEIARRLSWAEECRWQVPQQMPGQKRVPWGRIGPRVVNWHGRELVVDLGYRGSLWVPELGSAKWQKYEGPDWRRFQAVLQTSFRNVGGVLFVADSQEVRAEANQESLRKMADNLRFVGRRPEDVAMVFALNKRDLLLLDRPGTDLDSRVLSVAELREQLAWPRCDYIETVAITGEGVSEAVMRLIQLMHIYS